MDILPWTAEALWRRAEVADARRVDVEERCRRLEQIIRDHWSPSQAEALLADHPSDPKVGERTPLV